MQWCPDTGLAVPECSCRRCLEVDAARVSPRLPLAGEIKVTRLNGASPAAKAAERRKAA